VAKKDVLLASPRLASSHIASSRRASTRKASRLADRTNIASSSSLLIIVHLPVTEKGREYANSETANEKRARERTERQSHSHTRIHSYAHTLIQDKAQRRNRITTTKLTIRV